MLRTTYLYGGFPLLSAFFGVMVLPSFGINAGKAIQWLARDLYSLRTIGPSAWKLAFQFMIGAKLAWRLRRERCEHLHVHFAHTPAQIAMYASALANVPFTVTAHANDIFERASLLKEKAERAQRLVTISEFNKSFLEKGGIAPSRVTIVRCGVRSPDLLKMKRASTVPCVGSLGRLVEKKGFDVLIRAAALLGKQDQKLRLRIAGDGPLRDVLARLAQELAVAVEFDGSLDHSDVPAWMASLDLFVLACRCDERGDMDGIPVVLMEAMSQGTPVVSTRLSGIPELVEDGITGYLAAPDDPRDLALKIAEALGTPMDDQESMRRRALHRVRTEFDVDVNLDRLVEAIHGSR